MWCSELDREVDPLEIEGAPKEIKAIALLLVDTAVLSRQAKILALGLGIKQIGELDGWAQIFEDVVQPKIDELTILSNLGEGDEYDLSNAHGRPDL